MRRLVPLLFVISISALSILGVGVSPAFANSESWRLAQEAAYPNGAVYFLIGHLEEANAQKEFERFFSVARWLSNHGYQPIVISNARRVDIREAVMNPLTTGIIYSSHGNSAGQIFDADKVLLPKNIFKEGASRRFKFLVLSSCFGDQCTKSYEFAEGVNRTYWNGTTNTDDLFRFLNGQTFDERLFGNTQGGVRAKCSFQFLPPTPSGLL